MKVCDEENFFKWLFALAFLDIGTLLWGKIFFSKKLHDYGIGMQLIHGYQYDRCRRGFCIWLWSGFPGL